MGSCRNATGPGRGHLVEDSKVYQGLFARIQNGKIVEAWEIVDTVNLMRQLGGLARLAGSGFQLDLRLL